MSNKKAKAGSANDFKVTEAFKALRANIMFSILKQGCKRIVISSSLPLEGKSTVSLNLAKSLSKTDAKVLLVDADLRKPTIFRYAELDNSPGLSDILIKNEIGEMDKFIKKIDKHPKLDIITAGSTVPNPADIVANSVIDVFLSECDKRYDYVIIDTPPINVVSDSLYLAKKSDGVIIVVREKFTTHPELEKAIKSFEFVDVKILGLVLNYSRCLKPKGYYTKYYSGYYGSRHGGRVKRR